MRAAVAALLLAYAVVMAAASSRWLPRASWPLRAPRTGIAAWQAVVLSVVTSTVSAGLVLAIPCFRVSADPAVLRACLSLMREQYATRKGPRSAWPEACSRWAFWAASAGVLPRRWRVRGVAAPATTTYWPWWHGPRPSRESGSSMMITRRSTACLAAAGSS